MSDRPRYEILERLRDVNPRAVVLPGYDAAIIGIASAIHMTPVLAYDISKIVSILMQRDGMTEEEALEFHEYNIEGGFYGEGRTPIFVDPGGL